MQYLGFLAVIAQIYNFFKKTTPYKQRIKG